VNMVMTLRVLQDAENLLSSQEIIRLSVRSLQAGVS
jgi:hypothetical protein